MQHRSDIPNSKDSELIQSIVRGDTQAFCELFYAYSRPVVGFLTTLTGSSAAAEDISQDIFTYVWENREKLGGVRNFKSYLFTVARNSSFRYIRQNHKFYDLSADDLYPGSHTTSGAADELLVAHETELLIQIAVSRMPRLRRMVFTMSREEGLSNDQIARKLGVSNESVASHILAAKRDIREVITLFIILGYIS